MDYIWGIVAFTVFYLCAAFVVLKLAGLTPLLKEVRWVRLLSLSLLVVLCVDAVIAILWYCFIYPPWPEEGYWPDGWYRRACLMVCIVWMEVLMFLPVVAWFFADAISISPRTTAAAEAESTIDAG